MPASRALLNSLGQLIEVGRRQRGVTIGVQPEIRSGQGASLGSYVVVVRVGEVCPHIEPPLWIREFGSRRLKVACLSAALIVKDALEASNLDAASSHVTLARAVDVAHVF